MRIVLTAIFAIAFFTSSAPVVAEEDAGNLVHEFKIGVLNHDQDDLWSNYRREGGIDGNLELIFNAEMDLWKGTVRPAIGASLNSQGDTSKAYGAARWETTWGDNGLFALGIGGAVHNGDTKLVNINRKALGSKILFYFPIEAGYRLDQHNTISLFFDHVSNGWLADPNEGMDTLGIRYGYRF